MAISITPSTVHEVYGWPPKGLTRLELLSVNLSGQSNKDIDFQHTPQLNIEETNFYYFSMHKGNFV